MAARESGSSEDEWGRTDVETIYHITCARVPYGDMVRIFIYLLFAYDMTVKRDRDRALERNQGLTTIGRSRRMLHVRRESVGERAHGEEAKVAITTHSVTTAVRAAIPEDRV